MSDIQNVDERRSARLKVMLSAMLKHDGGHVQVRVLDLSRHGALIAADEIPSPGRDVALHCGQQSVKGWVAWVRGNQAGIDFDEAVNRHLFTSKTTVTARTVTTAEMVVKDRRQIEFRRPGFRGDQLTDDERLFMHQIMNDNRAMSRAACYR